MNRRTVLIVICLSSLVISSCRLPMSGSFPIRVTAESIDLAWDAPPQQAAIPGTEVAIYYVYFRKHGAGGWRLFTQVPAARNPSVTLSRLDFGEGAYDFAVSAANLQGGESRLHSSTDASADPSGGWYLIWY